ncbi:hypothetical protein IWQ56_001520, partial [Coemansia nantahalensis]
MVEVERRLSCIPSAETIRGDVGTPELPKEGKRYLEADREMPEPLKGPASGEDEDEDEFEDGRHKEDSAYAWVVVLAGCVMSMVTLGTSRAHGVYQEHYVESEFRHLPTATVAWIGTVQNTLLNLCGVFVGILSQVYDARAMCAAGSAAMGAGFILASFSTQVWQLALTQGALFGAAASFPYILGVTVPLQWIRRRRGLALAVVYSGSGVGGMGIAMLTRLCIDAVGRPWSNRIVGAIVMVLGLGLSPLIASRRPKRRPRRIVDLSVVREWRFLFIAAASFFSMAPNTVPYLLLPTYTATVLREPRRLGSLLVTIINVSGIFGRFVAGVLADRFGPVNTLIAWTALAAFSQLGVWLPFANVPAAIASAALFGVTGASIVGMILSALSHQFGVARITYISGLIYMAYSLSSLVVAQTTSLMLDT